VILPVQLSPVAGELFGMIVYRIDQGARRNVSLGVEGQIMQQLAKLLKVCSDGGGPCFLAPTPPLFLLVSLRGGSVFGLGYATSKRRRFRDANYQSLGAGSGAELHAVAGVEKSAGESGLAITPVEIGTSSKCVHGQKNDGHDADSQ
jgi:hypothetical protein